MRPNLLEPSSGFNRLCFGGLHGQDAEHNSCFLCSPFHMPAIHPALFGNHAIGSQMTYSQNQTNKQSKERKTKQHAHTHTFGRTRESTFFATILDCTSFPRFLTQFAALPPCLRNAQLLEAARVVDWRLAEVCAMDQERLREGRWAESLGLDTGMDRGWFDDLILLSAQLVKSLQASIGHGARMSPPFRMAL